jgi:hypothetical protein
MTTQTTFEDRLLDRLRLVVAANSAPPERGVRQPRRRRWPLAATGLAGAAVAAALIVVIAGGTQTAYAIDTQPNGSVTVHIASLRDAAGLQEALRRRGIPALVDYSATCTRMPAPPPGGVTRHGAGGPRGFEVHRAPAPARGARRMRVGVRVQVSRDANVTDGVMFTIDPGSIPAGQNVYITTYSREVNALSVGIGFKAPTPPCPPGAP